MLLIFNFIYLLLVLIFINSKAIFAKIEKTLFYESHLKYILKQIYYNIYDRCDPNCPYDKCQVGWIKCYTILATNACAYIPKKGETWHRFVGIKPRHLAIKDDIYYKGTTTLLSFRDHPLFQCQLIKYISDYHMFEKEVDVIHERIYNKFFQKFLSEHLVMMETIANDKITFAKVNYFESIQKNKYLYQRAESTKNFFVGESIFYYTAYEFYEYFTCLKHTYGDQCLLTCKASTRHSCNDAIVSKGNFKTVQACLGDWTLFPVTITYSVPRKRIMQITYRMQECIILNKCLEKTICENGTKCIVTGNNSYFCYQKKVLVLNNAYSNIKDMKKYLLIFNGNTITFVVDPKDIPKDQLNNFKIVVKPFFDSTVPTPTMARRVKKNSKLIMRGATFTVQSKPNDAGYDYTVSITVSYNGDMYSHNMLFNFTMIRIVNNLHIYKYNYYLLSGTWIKFSVDVFPDNKVTLTIKFNGRLFPFVHGHLIGARIHNSMYGHLYVQFRCDFSPVYDGIVSNITFRRDESRYFFVQQFFNFSWENSEKSSFTNGDYLRCRAITNLEYSIVIAQMYGYPVSEKNILTNGMPLYNLVPGVYTFSCSLCFKDNSSCYLRIKKFFFLRNPNYICILPYAEFRGMLLKCATNSYPPLVGTFAMTLYDSRYNMIIRRTPYNTLRLPFDLSFELNYSILCRYRFVPFENESFPIHLTLISKILVKRLLVQEQTEMSNCLNYSRFPQEILPKKNKNNKFVFHNYAFYLMTYVNHTGVNLAIIMYLLTVMIMIIVIVYNYWFRKPFDFEDARILDHHIEFLNKRNAIRKLNEKRLRKLHLMKTIAPSATGAFRGKEFENLTDSEELIETTESKDTTTGTSYGTKLSSLE